MWGTFGDPQKLPPKGEFFCKESVEWMPEVPGQWLFRSSETHATFDLLINDRGFPQTRDQGMTNRVRFTASIDETVSITSVCIVGVIL
jgi:hypothetical protein